MNKILIIYKRINLYHLESSMTRVGYSAYLRGNNAINHIYILPQEELISEGGLFRIKVSLLIDESI